MGMKFKEMVHVLQWKEEYLVGVDLIDEQHMKLIEIANRAYALLKNELITDKYDQTIEIIEELKAYTVYHFNCEEEYMKSIGYKKIFSHSILHREFLDKVSAVNLNEVDDDQNQNLIKIMNFVCDWLVSHIIREDKLITAK